MNLYQEKTRNVVVYGLALVACICLLLKIYGWLNDIPTHASPTKEVLAISHPAEGLTFIASIPSNRIGPETAQRVHVEMLADASVVQPEALTVCAQVPSRDPVCGDWPSQKGKLNRSMDVTVKLSEESFSQVVFVKVRSSGWPPDRKVGSSFQLSVLRLGPLHVEVYDASTERRLRALTRLRSLLKDITLPLLATFLTIFFARRASRRAEEAEVRRLLLNKVQGLTKSYYIHIVYHARYAIGYLVKGASNEGTYHLLCLLLFNWRLKEEEGGVFFSSQEAERVYRDAISWILNEVREQLGGERKFRPMLRKMQCAVRMPGADPKDPSKIEVLTLADYLALNSLPGPTSPNIFLICALNILKATTLYELDAPLYEHWYQTRGEMEFENVAASQVPKVVDLDSLPSEQQKAWRDLLSEARLWLRGKAGTKAYLNSLPKY